MPSECLFSLYSVDIGKSYSIFTNGELSPAKSVYRKQCYITALKLTCNICNSIKCEIFLAVWMDLSFRISALCIEDKQ